MIMSRAATDAKTGLNVHFRSEILLDVFTTVAYCSNFDFFVKVTLLLLFLQKQEEKINVSVGVMPLLLASQ
jgi:hypothetical protein